MIADARPSRVLKWSYTGCDHAGRMDMRFVCYVFR